MHFFFPSLNTSSTFVAGTTKQKSPRLQFETGGSTDADIKVTCKRDTTIWTDKLTGYSVDESNDT
jgi:hypothetical protein